MKLFLNNKSGFALINVVIGLVVVSLTISIVVNFNSYITKEEQISMEEFSLYTQINNIVEEAYAEDDWSKFGEANSGKALLEINNSNSVNYEYKLHTNPTKYGTTKLDIIFYDPPGINKDKLTYTLEKKFNNS